MNQKEEFPVLSDEELDERIPELIAKMEEVRDELDFLYNHTCFSEFRNRRTYLSTTFVQIREAYAHAKHALGYLGAAKRSVERKLGKNSENSQKNPEKI